MEERFRRIIAKNIKKCREESDFKQRQIAQYLGIEQVQVSYIENGKRPIDVVNLKKLADLYDIPMKEFLEEEISGKQLNKYAFRNRREDDNVLPAIAFLNEFSNNIIHLEKLLNES